MLLSHIIYHSGMSLELCVCMYMQRSHPESRACVSRARARDVNKKSVHIITPHMAEVVPFIRVVCAIGNFNNMAPYYTEIAANTWISPSKGTKLLLDHERSKLRLFHVKIMFGRFLYLAVGHLLKKKKKEMEKITVWPISVYTASNVF